MKTHLKSYKEFKIGDVITAYHKGYHEITCIIERKNGNPLIQYRTLFRADGTVVKSTSHKKCDVFYCNLAAKVLPEVIKKREEELEKLKKIFEEIS